jgi:hypothetical protein
LHSRIQLTSESVGTYTDDYLNLLSRAANTGNAIPERMKLTGYTEGLHPKLQESLILKEPETLTDAVRSAKYLEFQMQRLKSQGRKDVFTGQENQLRTNRDQQNQRGEPMGRPYRNGNNNNNNNHNGGQGRSFNGQNRNFNTRQAPGNHQPPPSRQNLRSLNSENANAQIADLARQMTNLQIKMSQMETSNDVHHFTLEELQDVQQDEEGCHDFDPMEIDSYPEEISMSPQDEKHKDQILYTNGNYDTDYNQTDDTFLTGRQGNNLISILILTLICQMLPL